MKQITRYIVAIMLAAGLSAPCFAATSNWNGTWKLDQARSHMVGSTYIISQTGPDSYHYTSGNLSENIICDGKAHPALAGADSICNKLPDGAYELSTLVNGKVLDKTHLAFSHDGKMVYTTTTHYLEDGKTAISHSRSTRLSGTTGLPGKWRESHYSTNSPDVQVYTLSGDTLNIYFPAEKQILNAKLDGTPASIAGPNAPKGITVSLRRVNSRQLHEIDRLNGKIISEGNDTLSADGKTLTETSVNPGQPHHQEIEVYVKQ